MIAHVWMRFRAALLVFVVILCAPNLHAGDELDDGSRFPDIHVVFDELDEPYLRVGANVDHAVVDSVREGMTVDEVAYRLGGPESVKHHDEVSDWHYNINLPFSGSDSVVVCQYRVEFDADGYVSTTDWRRRHCESLFTGVAPRSAELVTLSSDVLFDFDSHEVTAEGRKELEELARQLKQSYEEPLITLVGHTDRIGSDDYNLELSERRVASVRRVLSDQGIARDAIVAEGRGSREPVVKCDADTYSEAQLKECLRPNRRVEIEVLDRVARSAQQTRR